MARARSNVSLTALRNESPDIGSTQVVMRRGRRSSVPITREEMQTAVQETSVVEGSAARNPLQSAYQRFQKKPRPHTSHHNCQSSPRESTKQREALVPTPVNVSTQAIETLREQTGLPS